ncbi:NAD(P)/FAD-dependent oxidoreductase [Kineococcus rubinsiae]|uniref:NAD(P)/FAD-dependent oxidoreductase n=1 Tax=Kineococcus rubinsiae TaxID=2609562 RepID=UPI001431B442|nr:NAD(P)/FAD-dependent oxidoreductase [Kineococcus rubinsiae]NIZ93208.1 NAD(P)/FAD-dependent oxidoreductase [Kineococcus rubinsiae]
MSTLNPDVLVLGAGAAGLSAAVALGRSLRDVVVVDGGEPRNAPSAHAHNVLGREGIAPSVLLAAGRREAEGYGVRFVDDRVLGAHRDGDDLVVDLAGGTSVRARRLVLATGLRDELPDVEGLQRFWGSSVLHCPYCHGYEVRGRRIGILATGPGALHQTLLFRQLSERVTLFVQDVEVPAETAEQFRALGVEVLPGTVRGVGGTDGDLRVDLDGTEVAVGALVVGPYFRARAEVFTQLGGTLERSPYGEFVPTGPGGATAVPGVWAAGNVADPMAMVQAASAAGVMAGAAVNGDLVAAGAAAAVAAARQPA